MNDIMIDLETLGTQQTSVFVAVGACYFDPATGDIGETFYQRIDWQSALHEGRTMDADTIKWWLKQDEEARLEIAQPGEDISDVLDQLRRFIEPGAKVWGNGATFDISILENAFTYEYQAGSPWKFWNVRDVRTIVDLAKQLRGFDHNNVKREGTHHNALDDALHQAGYVSLAFESLKHG